MIELLLIHGVKFGLILSGLLMGVLLISQLINPEIMLNDYPPDVRERYGRPRASTARHKLIATAAFLLAISGVLFGALRTLPAPIGFRTVFIDVFVIFMIFNVVDLLVIDWLIFVRWQPKFIILPGTEGMKGYSDYGFHFRAFLIGTAMITVLSTVIAAVAVALKWI